MEPLSVLRKSVPNAFRVTETLSRAGYTAYFAGGCVRDCLLGRPPKDIDIASNAPPEQVEALFPRTHPIGKAFGVVQVVEGDDVFEVAAFRRDLEQTDGRRPGRIEPSTPEEDAQRRDFTINGLFLDPRSGAIIDFVGGQPDLASHLIRAIGQPADRFREDRLRMLRAVRFAAVLDFTIHPHTLAAIQAQSAEIRQISVERIQVEFTRLLTESPRPGHALEQLHAAGLLRYILPEFLDLQGCEQPPEFHPEGDVWTHTVMMLNHLHAPSPALALAVLLHDIGKPQTRTVENGRIRFTGHAQVGAEIAERWLRKMKYSNALRQQVVGMVDRHMNFMNVSNMRTATLRRFVARENFEEELELHRIDCLCSNGITESHDLLKQIRAQHLAAAALPTPWIDGRDLLRLGLREGPEIGKWKRIAYDAQLENHFPDKSTLLKWLSTEIQT